jgi:hypothetical protein
MVTFAHQTFLQITLDVCNSILGQSRVRISDQPPMSRRAECLEGSILITGELDIELRVVCPKAVAARLTNRMYGNATDAPSDENLNEGLREVISVIGRDVKEAVGVRSSLSFPRVRECNSASDFALPWGFCDFEGDVLTVHLADTIPDDSCPTLAAPCEV